MNNEKPKLMQRLAKIPAPLAVLLAVVCAYVFCVVVMYFALASTRGSEVFSYSLYEVFIENNILQWACYGTIGMIILFAVLLIGVEIELRRRAAVAKNPNLAATVMIAAVFCVILFFFASCSGSQSHYEGTEDKWNSLSAHEKEVAEQSYEYGQALEDVKSGN